MEPDLDSEYLDKYRAEWPSYATEPGVYDSFSEKRCGRNQDILCTDLEMGTDTPGTEEGLYMEATQQNFDLCLAYVTSGY